MDFREVAGPCAVAVAAAALGQKWRRALRSRGGRQGHVEEESTAPRAVRRLRPGLCLVSSLCRRA